SPVRASRGITRGSRTWSSSRRAATPTSWTPRTCARASSRAGPGLAAWRRGTTHARARKARPDSNTPTVGRADAVVSDELVRAVVLLVVGDPGAVPGELLVGARGATAPGRAGHKPLRVHARDPGLDAARVAAARRGGGRGARDCDHPARHALERRRLCPRARLHVAGCRRSRDHSARPVHRAGLAGAQAGRGNAQEGRSRDSPT